MKIILAEHFGMCFGVRDAIAQAVELARQAPLTILGELVHNPIVREHLRAQGVQEAPIHNELGGRAANGRVMITAHGTSDISRKSLTAAGHEVADATCPLVRHAHHQLKLLVSAGYFPVVIGKAGHVEVLGLTGDFPGARVIESAGQVSTLPVQDRYGVISQTTQPIEHVCTVVAEIRRLRPKSEVRFVDTVCKPTKDRQEALHALIVRADTIVVVGGRGSNNTWQLVETCRAGGKRAIHIERPDELDPKDFVDLETVGLTAGTSTLPATVEAVRKRLEEISLNQNQDQIIRTSPITT